MITFVIDDILKSVIWKKKGRYLREKRAFPRRKGRGPKNFSPDPRFPKSPHFLAVAASGEGQNCLINHSEAKTCEGTLKHLLLD